MKGELTVSRADLYIIRKLCSKCLGIAERKGVCFVCNRCGEVEKPQDCLECEEDGRALAIQNYVLMQDKQKLEKNLLILSTEVRRLKMERDRALDYLEKIRGTDLLPPNMKVLVDLALEEGQEDDG